MKAMLLRSKYLRGAGLAAINHLCLYAGNFITYFLLVRSLSIDLLGIWGIFITWVTISDQIRHGLIHNGFIRLYNGEEYTKAEKLSTVFYLNGMITILSTAIITVIVFVWINFSETGLRELSIFSFSLALVSLSIIQILNTIYIAQNRLKLQFRTNLIYTLLTVPIALGLYYIEKLEIETLLISQIIVSLVILISYLAYARISLKNYNLEIARSLLNFGKFSARTNVLSLLFHKADIIILSLFTGATSIGVYHFASKIINYIEIPLNGLSQFIYPKLAESILTGDKKVIRKTYQKGLLLMQACLLPGIILAIIYPDIFPWLFGAEELQSASQLIRVLAIASIIKPLGRVFGMSLDAIGKPKINMWLLAFSLLCNLALNFTLIPYLDALGAAIATTLSIYLTIIGGQIIIKKKVKELDKTIYIKLNINYLLNNLKLKISWN